VVVSQKTRHPKLYYVEGHQFNPLSRRPCYSVANGGLSDFLGDPPPDPRFLASLGALSLAELHHCCVVDLFDGFWTTHDSAPSEAKNGGLGEDPPGSPMTYHQVLWTCPKNTNGACLVGHAISGLQPFTARSLASPCSPL
jgi:hypothetical protein